MPRWCLLSMFILHTQQSIAIKKKKIIVGSSLQRRDSSALLSVAGEVASSTVRSTDHPRVESTQHLTLSKHFYT